MNYLIPVDAKLAADSDVEFEAIPLDQVMASVEGAKKLRSSCSTPAATTPSHRRCAARWPCGRSAAA